MRVADKVWFIYDYNDYGSGYLFKVLLIQWSQAD